MKKTRTKTKKKTFRVYYDFVMGGCVEIEAKSEEEAETIFYKHVNEDRMSELPLNESNERCDYKIWDIEEKRRDTYEV